MITEEKWKINKTADFSDIEQIDIHLEMHKDGTATAMKDASHTFPCKPMSSFRFLFKRYPLMVVPTIFLSLAFLWLHTVAFFIYAVLTILLFTLAVRMCRIKSISKYILVFWILHILGNFLILGGASLTSFSIALSQRHYYIQGLFFGMLLAHIWLYVLIFIHQYHRVFNIMKEEDGEQVPTEWYVWKGCKLCNHHYIPFKNNCGEV